MKIRKIASVIAAAALVMGVSTSAFAAFTDLSLERFVYNSTTEVGTDLGNVQTLLSNTGSTTIGTGASSFVSLGLTSSTAPLYVAYYSYDSNTQSMWIAAAKGLGTITVTDAAYSSGTNISGLVNNYYSHLTAVTSDGATSAKTGNNDQGSSTWFNTSDKTQAGLGGYASMLKPEEVPGTSVKLDLTSAVTQGLYFFDTSTAEEGKPFVFKEIGTVTTNTDGSTTVSANSAAQTPIPAAFYLMGSGLLGLVGIRRKQNK